MRTRLASMLRKPSDRWARRWLATSLILAVASCATVDTAVVANPGADFNLAVGKSATISGTDYRITFNRVTEDSRCPVDVQCVWAGDAKIELTVARNSAPDATRVISLTPPNSETTVGNVKIRFVSLAPTPRQSEPPASRPYVARLMVLAP
jgi:hypothetical protein